MFKDPQRRRIEVAKRSEDEGRRCDGSGKEWQEGRGAVQGRDNLSGSM